MSFEQWLAKVDSIIGRMCGLGYMDLPDQNYRINFDDGMTADEQAREALEYADFPMDLF